MVYRNDLGSPSANSMCAAPGTRKATVVLFCHLAPSFDQVKLGFELLFNFVEAALRLLAFGPNVRVLGEVTFVLDELIANRNERPDAASEMCMDAWCVYMLVLFGGVNYLGWCAHPTD